MSDTLLDVQNLTMKFGGLIAIDDLTFSEEYSNEAVDNATWDRALYGRVASRQHVYQVSADMPVDYRVRFVNGVIKTKEKMFLGTGGAQKNWMPLLWRPMLHHI